MKFLSLIFLFSVTASSLVSAIPLSDRSMQSIQVTALKGAHAGVILSWMANTLVNYFSCPHHKMSIEKAMVKNGVYALSGGALAGAVCGALYAYFYSPEKHFEYAQKQTAKIASDSIIQIVSQAKP